jgi:hypothetical protein
MIVNHLAPKEWTFPLVFLLGRECLVMELDDPSPVIFLHKIFRNRSLYYRAGRNPLTNKRHRWM